MRKPTCPHRAVDALIRALDRRANLGTQDDVREMIAAARQYEANTLRMIRRGRHGLPAERRGFRFVKLEREERSACHSTSAVKHLIAAAHTPSVHPATLERAIRRARCLYRAIDSLRDLRQRMHGYLASEGP